MPILCVLWALGVLAAVCASLLWGSKLSSQLVFNDSYDARLNATVEAAVHRSTLGLLERRPELRWRGDGSSHTFAFNGASTEIAVQDVLGLIDLNRAGAPLLAGLLQSSGLDMKQAAELAARIIDWREADRSQENVIEQTGRNSEPHYRPRHGAFQSIDELLLVPGMSPALYARIEPALTIYSGRQFVNPHVAPREVLAALPDMPRERTEAILADRIGLGSRAPGDEAIPLRGRAFRVQTTLKDVAVGARYEITMRLTEDPSRPFWVLDWRRK